MTTKAKRRQLSPEFKVEALKLATKTSVASAAKDPGINEAQLYNWRSAASKKLSTSARESGLATEVAKLKRQLAEQAEELEIIKKEAPTSQRTKNRVALLHARALMPVLCYPNGLYVERVEKWVLRMNSVISAPQHTGSGPPASG